MTTSNFQCLIQLDTAALRSKKQKRACIWHTNGLAIEYDGKIPTDAIVGRTSVLVGNNDACILMLICVSPVQVNATVISVGQFSNLNELREHHPELFEVMGTYDML